MSTTMINSPSFGRVVFDAVLRTDHNGTVQVTQHPVQTGASISDHAFCNPDELQLEIGMSDAAVNASGGPGRSVNAYKTLRAIMDKRELVTVVTRLNTYSNMLITAISSPDDYTTMFGLRASIYFTQVKIVNVSTVTVQQTVSGTKPPASGGTGGGGGGTGGGGGSTSPAKPTTTTTPPKQSVLSQIAAKVKTATTVTTTKVSTKIVDTVKKVAATVKASASTSASVTTKASGIASKIANMLKK